MAKPDIAPDKTICWVYIRRKKNNDYLIGYSLNLYHELVDATGGVHLLFYRRFGNIADAIAYKLLLEHLSRETIEYIVSKDNPYHRNLQKEFLKTSGNNMAN